MGYLDKDGLSRAFTKLKTLIDQKVDATRDGTNAAINRLSVGTARPEDDDYYICQYVGGGNTTTTYYRRPVSSLWSYIKTKTDSLYQVRGSYAAANHSHSAATVSANGFMPSADKAKLDALGGIVSISKSIKLTTSWMDTGISGSDLSNGTYVVQVGGLSPDDGILTYLEIWSGIMSWYAGSTNSTNAEEILLHNAGQADNSGEIYLRTIRTSGMNCLKLQIASNIAATKADNVVFKFRKLI